MSDTGFFVIFVAEFVVKVLHHGLYWEHKLAYFKQSWNVLDFVILVFQTLDLIGVEGLKSLVRIAIVNNP